VSYIDRRGAPGEPVAILTPPTPGPLTAVDAALAQAGGRAARHPVLRVGAAPLSAVLSAPPYAPLAITPPAALAREATQLASGGKLFVVAPGAAPLSAFLTPGAVNPRADLGPVFGSGTDGVLFAAQLERLSPFLRALGGRFRPVATRTFPGFLQVTVYEFRLAR
jgi:hypothetical protein